MYNTYIFDLDGTMLDTLQDLADSVNYALRQHGMPEHSIDDIRRFVGNGVRLLMERAVPDGAENPQFEVTFATFRQHYMKHSLDTTHPYEGISELIHELKARGCKMAVVSNKMMAATQDLVRHFFPDIEVAIGENEAAGIRKKPAPDTVFEALRQLGYPPTSHPSPLTSNRKLTYKEKREFEQLEKDIAALEEEKKQIEAALCGGTTSVEEITKLSKRLPILNDELDEKSMRWLELSVIEN